MTTWPPPVPVPLENVTYVTGERQPIAASDLQLLETMTRLDSELIARLVADGLLRARPNDELDREWEATATRLGFDLV